MRKMHAFLGKLECTFLGKLEYTDLQHLQGWVTLQVTRELGYPLGFFSARSVMGFLSDVYPSAADEVGKIYLVAGKKVCTSKEYHMLI